MSLVQTAERRDAGGRGENWSPLLHSSQEHSLLSVLYVSLYVSLLLVAFPLSSRGYLFFRFSFEALFNFCRGIFPTRGDYCSQEIEEENRAPSAAATGQFRTLRERRERIARNARGSRTEIVRLHNSTWKQQLASS